MKYLQRLKKEKEPTSPTDKTVKSPSVSFVSSKSERISENQTAWPDCLYRSARDFTVFCLAHENTYKEGYCPIKRDPYDPFSKCLGWKMKNNRHH